MNDSLPSVEDALSPSPHSMALSLALDVSPRLSLDCIDHVQSAGSSCPSHQLPVDESVARVAYYLVVIPISACSMIMITVHHQLTVETHLLDTPLTIGRPGERITKPVFENFNTEENKISLEVNLGSSNSTRSLQDLSRRDFHCLITSNIMEGQAGLWTKARGSIDRVYMLLSFFCVFLLLDRENVLIYSIF